MTTRRFYTSETANNSDVVKVGFIALFQAAKAANLEVVRLICATKGNLEGFIEDLMGREVVKTLKKTGTVNISGISVVFHHERAIPYSAEGTPVLLCYPDEKLLQKVDAMQDIPTLIVLPWTMDNIKPWLLAHGATDLLQKADISPCKISNPVVEQALKGMLLSINTSTGIVHSSDKATAIETFETLSAAGELYDPHEVGAWFVQHGVSSEHAATITEVARNPAGFRSADKANWGKQALERWRADAKKES
jgi:hypothetical protein